MSAEFAQEVRSSIFFREEEELIKRRYSDKESGKDSGASRSTWLEHVGDRYMRKQECRLHSRSIRASLDLNKCKEGQNV